MSLIAEMAQADFSNNLASVPYVHLFHDIMEHSLNFWNTDIPLNVPGHFRVDFLEKQLPICVIFCFSRRGEISLRAVAQQVLRNGAALNEFIYAMFPVFQLSRD